MNKRMMTVGTAVFLLLSGCSDSSDSGRYAREQTDIKNAQIERVKHAMIKGKSDVYIKTELKFQGDSRYKGITIPSITGTFKVIAYDKPMQENVIDAKVIEREGQLYYFEDSDEVRKIIVPNTNERYHLKYYQVNPDIRLVYRVDGYKMSEKALNRIIREMY